MDEVRVLVFAKAPVPGAVKTRLAGAIGDEAAARLYRAMARQCIGNACEAFPGFVEVWCEPDSTHPFFGECAWEWGIVLRDQAAGDIGARMSHALQETLRTSAAALLIGTDVPSIGAADIRVAAAVLHTGKAAVICPTEDGGYGLIGMRCHDARAFGGIDWGSSAVMAQTRQRFEALGWDWRELPVRWDVDTPQDLDRLAALPAFASLFPDVHER